MIQFTESGWKDYTFWAESDKKKSARIHELIKDCLRTPFSGIGKPEPLKADFAGFWSRRIDDTHRLVYRFESGVLYIISCRFHYKK